MASDRELAEKVVGHMLARDNFSRWLGVELLSVAPGRAELAMTVREDMLNGFGVCHGGVTFSLADSALAFASNTHGRVTVSIENSMAYPAKVSLGDRLTAVARELSAGYRIATYEVLVNLDDGTKVGIFRGTVYRGSQPHFPEA